MNVSWVSKVSKAVRISTSALLDIVIKTLHVKILSEVFTAHVTQATLVTECLVSILMSARLGYTTVTRYQYAQIIMEVSPVDVIQVIVKRQCRFMVILNIA